MYSIINERVNIHIFLRFISQSYKEIIEFVEPKTLNGVDTNAKYCYDINILRHKQGKI